MFATVKPVIEGHSDERTPSDQGLFSHNGLLSSPCWGIYDEGTPVMLGHFLLDIEVSLEDRFYCNCHGWVWLVHRVPQKNMFYNFIFIEISSQTMSVVYCKRWIIGNNLFGEIGKFKKFSKFFGKIKTSHFLDIPLLENAKLILRQIAIFENCQI